MVIKLILILLNLPANLQRIDFQTILQQQIKFSIRVLKESNSSDKQVNVKTRLRGVITRNRALHL